MKSKKTIMTLFILLHLLMAGCSGNFQNSKTIKKIEGSSTRWTDIKKTEYEFKKGQTVNFKYNSTVKGGELKMELINPEKEVLINFDTNKKGELKQLISESGTYVIVIEGNNFNGNYAIKFGIED